MGFFYAENQSERRLSSMLRSFITEKIMCIAEAFDMGMLIWYAKKPSDNNSNMYDLPVSQRRKWAYSGQSSFFLNKNLVL